MLDAIYEGTTYEQRERTTHELDALVIVGPAYRMGGTYEMDGTEGLYRVRRRCDGDYLLRHTRCDFAVWVHASRLVAA